MNASNIFRRFKKFLWTVLSFIVSHVLRCINTIIFNFASQILFLYLIVSQPENVNHNKMHDCFSQDLIWHCLGKKSDRFKNASRTRMYLSLVLFYMSRWQCSKKFGSYAIRELSGITAGLKEKI